MKTHGLRFHPLYKKWINLKNRCYNKNNKDYKYYGGRGISFSYEFKNDAKSFIEYISGLTNAAREGYSLDRIDNDGDYTRGNIKWSTISEQTLNRRKFKNNTSGHTGIYFNKSKGKFEARIGKQQIGTYLTIEAAIETRGNMT